MEYAEREAAWKSQINERDKDIRTLKDTIENDRALWQEKWNNKERESRDISVKFRQREEELINELMMKEKRMEELLHKLEEEKKDKEQKLKEIEGERARFRKSMEEKIHFLQAEFQEKENKLEEARVQMEKEYAQLKTRFDDTILLWEEKMRKAESETDRALSLIHI